MDPWEQVVGQREALDRLEKAAVNPVHAYLFLGRRGAGTMAAARGFAGLLLAAAVEGDEARERAIRLAVAGRHPDAGLIEPEGSTLRVSEAEAIIKAGLRSPVEAARKVIIVDGVDSIEENAIGKLLKVVEEPPPSAVFILLATEVPPEIVTIASRCVIVEFHPLTEAELAASLVADGIGAERAAVAASAAGGDLERARLLATDDELAARAELWRSIPERLDGTGSVVCELVEAARESMDRAQGPLEERQRGDLEELEARVEQLGERGSGRADLAARHKREIRRLRTDELRFGLAVLSRVYRDRLIAGSDPAAEAALSAITDVVDDMVFNPNEPLMLQHLLLRLSPSPSSSTS